MATTPQPDTPRGPDRLRPFIWGGAAALLLLPAIAMRFDTGVDWTASDFAVMGAMLAVACGLYEFAARLSGSTAYRGAFGMAVVTGFLTVWVNLAVGMIGSEDDPLNLMFGGVLLVAATGALLARFHAAGMARAMTAAAVAQAVAAAIGLAVGLASGTDETGGPGVAYQAFLTACFALPWLASAALFRRAARAPSPA